ncbi:hypothetical protein GQ42DRAFT_164836 [Ramicandelaber brevisporus]|nr:hypothetical protein GQ42DRAFT_164836 [Ramicandelaber brevisporus]
MKVSVLFGAVVATSLGFAGVADAWSSPKACCLINKLRVAIGRVPLKYAACTDGIAELNNERQIAIREQAHKVDRPHERFAQLCRAYSNAWGEGAASHFDGWRTEEAVIEALRNSAKHYEAMVSPAFSVCGTASKVGPDGLPYSTTEYFGTSDKTFLSSLPDPCQLIGQGGGGGGGGSPTPQQPPSKPAQPDRNGHNNQPPAQQPQKPAPQQPLKPAPQQPAPPAQPLRNGHNNNPSPPAQPPNPAPETKKPEQPAPEVKQPVAVPPPAYNPPTPAPQQCCNCCPVSAPYLGSN